MAWGFWARRTAAALVAKTTFGITQRSIFRLILGAGHLWWRSSKWDDSNWLFGEVFDHWLTWVLTRWPQPWCSWPIWFDGTCSHPSLTTFFIGISWILGWGCNGDWGGPWDIEDRQHTLGEPRNKWPVVVNWLNSSKLALKWTWNLIFLFFPCF